MAEAQYLGLPDTGSQSPAAALASTIARISQLALNVSTGMTCLPGDCTNSRERMHNAGA